MKWVETKDGGKHLAYYVDESTSAVLAYIDELEPGGVFDVVRRDHSGFEGGHYPIGAYLDYEKAKEATEKIYLGSSLANAK